jgi:hypothetical protein
MGWTTPSTKTTGTLVTAAIWNEQVTANMTWLGTSHDHDGGAGDGATLNFATAGMIGIFDAACPAGWTRVSAFDDKFLYGGAAYGATGGSDTHTHASSHAVHTGAHVHAVGTLAPGAASPGGISLGAGGYNAATGTHTHALSGISGAMAVVSASTDLTAVTKLPTYIAVVFCKKDA